MIESSLGIIGASLPLLRPLFAGATSHGFMRRLRTVNLISYDGGSDTLWDPSRQEMSAKGLHSPSTFQFGSKSSISTKVGSTRSQSNDEKTASPKQKPLKGPSVTTAELRE